MTTNDLIKCIEKTVANMQEVLDDPKKLGIVLQNVNYSHNYGAYLAYMNVLMEQDFEKFSEIRGKYFNTVEKLARIADVRYQCLKKICNIE